MIRLPSVWLLPGLGVGLVLVFASAVGVVSLRGQCRQPEPRWPAVTLLLGLLVMVADAVVIGVW